MKDWSYKAAFTRWIFIFIGNIEPEIELKFFYNEEFDPGSGWTLAGGLTHASRGAAFLAC